MQYPLSNVPKLTVCSKETKFEFADELLSKASVSSNDALCLDDESLDEILNCFIIDVQSEKSSPNNVAVLKKEGCDFSGQPMDFYLDGSRSLSSSSKASTLSITPPLALNNNNDVGYSSHSHSSKFDEISFFQFPSETETEMHGNHSCINNQQINYSVSQQCTTPSSFMMSPSPNPLTLMSSRSFSPGITPMNIGGNINNINNINNIKNNNGYYPYCNTQNNFNFNNHDHHHHHNNNNNKLKLSDNVNPHKISNKVHNDLNNTHNKYSGMTLDSIIALKPPCDDLLQFDLIPLLIDYQRGSKYLQYYLPSCSEVELNRVTDYCITSHMNNINCVSNNHNRSTRFDFVRSSENYCGNFVIQKLFINSNCNNFQQLLNAFVYANILRLSKNSNGCRVIQEVIKVLASEHWNGKYNELLFQLILSLKNQILGSGNKFELHNLLIGNNANHVLQTIINSGLATRHVDFIQNELQNNLFFHCKNKVSCRIVQCSIRVYGDTINLMQLFSNNDHMELCAHPFGNYVIQCALEPDKAHSKLLLIQTFANQLIYDVFEGHNIFNLSKSKFGSNVVETCLNVSNIKQKNKLILNLAQNSLVIPKMIKHKFGNYCFKTLLNSLNYNQQKNIIRLIQRYCPEILAMDTQNVNDQQMLNATSNSRNCGDEYQFSRGLIREIQALNYEISNESYYY